MRRGAGRRRATRPRSMPKGRAARADRRGRPRATSRALAGVPPRCVTFVSGGTEAANAALNPRFGVGQAEPPLERLIVSARRACRASSRAIGFPASAVEIAPLRRRRTDRSRLARRGLPPPGAPPARAPGREQRDRRRPAGRRSGGDRPRGAADSLFCDAVQLAGRADFSLAALGADALALSAHKFGGPKGAGALIAAARGVSLGEPLLRGGGQERGRAGRHGERRRRSPVSAPPRGPPRPGSADEARAARGASRRPRRARSARPRRTPSSSAPTRRGCPTRCASPFPASRRRR